MAKPTKAPDQIANFKKLAAELECDESESAFEKTVKKIARPPKVATKTPG